MENLNKRENLLKDRDEHGYEDYTENIEKPRVIMSFKKGCGCANGGGCKCGGKK